MALAPEPEVGVNGLGNLQLINRLNESRSPYVSPHYVASRPTRKKLKLRFFVAQVRGHMNNPVAWQMWGPEALNLAKKHNRLLFVSIGYAACHCTSSCLFDNFPS